MLTGPIPVTEKVLKKAGMAIGDVDLFELNEAFASVVLRYMQAFDIPHDKMNVNGGAIAMGHPLGATGAMILGTVLDELERRDLSTALVTLCIGIGMAHKLVNRGSRDAVCFEVGTRAKAERVYYSDVDLVMERDEKGRRYLHRNGKPYA